MKIMIFLGCRVSASYTFTSHFSYFYEYESGFVFGLRIQIYEVADYGSNLDPDPQHWLTAKNSTDTKYLYPDPFAEYGAQSSRPSKKRIRIRNIVWQLFSVRILSGPCVIVILSSAWLSCSVRFCNWIPWIFTARAASSWKFAPP